MRKTIWMNESLLKLQEKLDRDGLGQKQGRSGGYSRRLGEIVERYDLIISSITAPDLTDSEKIIIEKVISTHSITPVMIKYLEDFIIVKLDIDKQELYLKLKKLNINEKIVLIESLENS